MGLGTNHWFSGSNTWVLTLFIYSYHIESHRFFWFLLATQTLASLFNYSRKDFQVLLCTVQTHSDSTSRDSAPALPGVGPASLHTAALTVIVPKFYPHQTMAAFSTEIGMGICLEQMLPTCQLFRAQVAPILAVRRYLPTLLNG